MFWIVWGVGRKNVFAPLISGASVSPFSHYSLSPLHESLALVPIQNTYNVHVHVHVHVQGIGTNIHVHCSTVGLF